MKKKSKPPKDKFTKLFSDDKINYSFNFLFFSLMYFFIVKFV